MHCVCYRFNDDNNFAKAMSEVLYLQKAINLEAPRLLAAIDKADLSFRERCVGNPARILLLAGWVRCRPRGLDTTIDLRGSQLDVADGVALAELMARHPRLTAVDVRSNESLGEEGVAALGRVLRHTHPMEAVLKLGGSHAPRSLCGVTSIKSTLDVPRSMSAVDAALVATELECCNYAEGVASSMGATTKASKDVAQLNRRSNKDSDWMPLLWAAKVNNVAVATRLLDTGANVDMQESEHQGHSRYSALHWAAVKGHADVATLLLQRGARLDLHDKHGNTPKLLAEKKTHKAMAELLDAAEKAASKKR